MKLCRKKINNQPPRNVIDTQFMQKEREISSVSDLNEKRFVEIFYDYLYGWRERERG
jgi:hypothetical protein